MNALRTDTIAALATPPGRSSVAMFRVSGPSAFTVCDMILCARRTLDSYAGRTLHRAVVRDPHTPNDTVDDVLVAIFQAPRSYTGEDVVEITCHGGEVPIRRILELLLAHGARLAEPGEFTLRAYLNGKLDLAQAEAVADLIDARTDEAHRLAHAQQSGLLSAEVGRLRGTMLGVLARIEATIDFPEDVGDFPLEWGLEELAEAGRCLSRLIASAGRGMLVRDGIRAALIGSPNAGKSSLLNALLRRDRAIVTPIAGTTRDVIEESVILHGIVVRLSDTAGIRDSDDAVEQLGVNRSKQAAELADIVLWIRDASESERLNDDSDFRQLTDGKPLLIIWNKIDLVQPERRNALTSRNSVVVSALTGAGIDNLELEIARLAKNAFGGGEDQWSTEAGQAVVTHARHLSALREAAAAVDRGRDALEDGLPLDFVSIEMQTALDSLGAVTGESAPQDVIGEIFSKFCIGK